MYIYNHYSLERSRRHRQTQTAQR